MHIGNILLWAASNNLFPSLESSLNSPFTARKKCKLERFESCCSLQEDTCIQSREGVLGDGSSPAGQRAMTSLGVRSTDEPPPPTPSHHASVISIALDISHFVLSVPAAVVGRVFYTLAVSGVKCTPTFKSYVS